MNARPCNKSDLLLYVSEQMLRTLTEVPFIQDSIPVEEEFERAGAVLVGGGSAWLTGASAVAFDGSDGVGVEFQAGRTTERGDVVIGLRWVSSRGPFEILDADLRLEPLPPSRSHLSLSGSYDASSRDADDVDYNSQKRTERYVRRFLIGVADTLEQLPTGPS
jgi:hypothetical protein